MAARAVIPWSTKFRASWGLWLPPLTVNDLSCYWLVEAWKLRWWVMLVMRSMDVKSSHSRSSYAFWRFLCFREREIGLLFALLSSVTSSSWRVRYLPSLQLERKSLLINWSEMFSHVLHKWNFCLQACLLFRLFMKSPPELQGPSQMGA